MKTLERLLTTYVRLTELVSTKKASNLAFNLFQRTQPKMLSNDEKSFYAHHTPFLLENEADLTHVYELGVENDKLVFLVHGWNSNAGSMASIACELAKQGFHCVLFDLPGHENSKRNLANIKVCAQVFKAVLNRIKQEKPIHVIAHSFGSAVSAYALSQLNIKVDRLIYLTCPNTLGELFLVLKERLGLSAAVYKGVIKEAEQLLQEKLDEITVLKKTGMIDYQRLYLLHDQYDKILPIQYSELLENNLENSTLLKYQRIGHYRMLSNPELIKDISSILTFKEASITTDKSIKKAPGSTSSVPLPVIT